jgi:hypothetical protein
MKIVPNQKFKHDGQTYEEGQEYDVADELGAYFNNVGWVGDDKEKAVRSHGMPAAGFGLPVTGSSETEAVASELEKVISNLRSRRETGVKLG